MATGTVPPGPIGPAQPFPSSGQQPVTAQSTGGFGTDWSSAPNTAQGGVSSVIPGWQGPQQYQTAQASYSEQQVAAQQAAQAQAASQYASGVLGTFFGSGAGYAPQYNPSYQAAFPVAQAQAYQQIAQQTAVPASAPGTVR